MKSNVNKVIERGDRLEDLQDKSGQTLFVSLFILNVSRLMLYTVFLILPDKNYL